MAEEQTTPAPFQIRDCALAAIATGERAQNLREMRDVLLDIDAGSIYYHFWDTLLRRGFGEREYNNDFAEWAFEALHDDVLAERLAVIDPAEFPDIEQLRQELIDVIEERLDEIQLVPWSRADRLFHFVRAQMVVFDTHQTIASPEDLVDIVPRISASSLFYHFIDARRRDPALIDDFRSWLLQWGEAYTDLVRRVGEIDPYFSALVELRRELSDVFADYFGRVPQ